MGRDSSDSIAVDPASWSGAHPAAMPALGLALQVRAVSLELPLHSAGEQPPERRQQPSRERRGPPFEFQRHSGSRPLRDDPMLDPIGGAVVEGGQDKQPWQLDLGHSHLLGRLTAEHGPRLAKARAHAHRCGGQERNALDGGDEVRPVGKIGHDREHGFGWRLDQEFDRNPHVASAPDFQPRWRPSRRRQHYHGVDFEHRPTHSSAASLCRNRSQPTLKPVRRRRIYFYAVQPGDIIFDIVAEDTDHPVATVSFETPAGQIQIMAEVEEEGRTLRLIGMHIQGAGANAVGIANLRILVDADMERWTTMSSKLKERLERLGRVRDVDRVASGSPVDLVLRPGPDRAKIKRIDATMALARRGMTMLRAKRAIEAMLDDGEVVVEVPTVEDFAALARDLSKAGVQAARIATDPVDVRSLRVSLGMSQEQFARRFNLDLDALQNWEQGRRSPERAVWSYLRVIAADPKAAARAQEEGARRRTG